MINDTSLNRRVTSSGSDLEGDQKLRELIASQLQRQRHFRTTAELIDLLIERYPDCPQFISMTIDRLMAGDDALAEALNKEGF